MPMTIQLGTAMRAIEREAQPSNVVETGKTRLPDHYPLVTPTGTIPVSQLALHGRLRDTLPHDVARAEPGPLDADYQWEIPEREIQRLERWEPRPRVSREAGVRVVRGEDGLGQAAMAHRRPLRVVEERLGPARHMPADARPSDPALHDEVTYTPSE